MGVITTAATPPATSNAAAWASIAVLLLGVLLAEWAAPMPIEARSLNTLAIACAALGSAAWFYRHIRSRENFAVMCTALMQVLIFSALGSILSYLLARDGGPLWDSTFAAWDRALGLDWLGFVRAIDEHGWLVTTLRLAYASLIAQIIVLVLVLGFTSRLEKLRAVMLGAILCGTISVLASPFFPAASNYVHLGLTAADFRFVDPWAGYIHLADFNGLRGGSMAQLDLSKMQGIITFPSYHAGLSAVTLWGFWTSGVRWLKWTGSFVALATIVATPVDGGHYFVDVLAGVGIAVASIHVAARAVRWTPAWPRLTAWPFRRSHAASGQ
ncbi:MAG: phosphatase PAP2 family protein [Sphingomonas bacterium]|nr:phosphatase PAP2 family protein [Sphingomonas bacterium]